MYSEHQSIVDALLSISINEIEQAIRLTFTNDYLPTPLLWTLPIHYTKIPPLVKKLFKSKLFQHKATHIAIRTVPHFRQYRNTFVAMVTTFAIFEIITNFTMTPDIIERTDLSDINGAAVEGPNIEYEENEE